MLQKNLLLLIGGKYNIDFYLEEIFQMILKSISQNQKKYNATNLKIEDSGVCDSIFYFNNYLLQLQVSVIKDLCDSEYVHKYFSKLLGKKIETLEDYTIIESIMCDYHNVLAYTVTLYHRLAYPLFKSLPYFKPYSKNQFDNYNLRIKTGIEIKFEYTTEFEEIVGFDELGNLKVLEKDGDYFIDGYNSLNLINEVLKMENIIEIEITSSENTKRRFYVKDYLNE
jgi:hypothetical protein